MSHSYYYDPSFPSIENALRMCHTEKLRMLAKLFVAKPPADKEDRVQAILNALDGEGLRRVYDVMKPLEKTAIVETAHDRDGRFRPLMFQAKYGESPPRNANRYRHFNNAEVCSVLDAFLFNDVMPKDIRQRFKAFVPNPRPDKLATLDKLPAKVPAHRPTGPGDVKHPTSIPLTLCETEPAALHDVMAMLRLVDAGKVAVSKSTGRLSLVGLKAILPILKHQDFVPEAEIARATDAIRGFSWPVLLVSAGLAAPAGSKLSLTNAGHQAMVMPTPELIKLLWNRWNVAGAFDEFSRIDKVKGGNPFTPASVLKGMVACRSAILKTLNQCPDGQWIALDEFLRFFRGSGVEMPRIRHRWEVELAGMPFGLGRFSDEQMWLIVEGRYIMCYLWEYAATLGLLDIAYTPAAHARDDFRDSPFQPDVDAISRYDGLRYFRINPLGAYCLERTKSYDAPGPLGNEPLLKVLPNHEVVVTDQDAFQTADAIFLDRVCTKTNLSTWKLNKQKILNAMHEGFRPFQIETFLRTKSSNGLPANVKRWLDDTIDVATRVSEVGPAQVFEAKDSGTALLILHAKRMKHLCYAAGATRIIVPAEHVDSFKRELQKLGYVLQPRKSPN